MLENFAWALFAAWALWAGFNAAVIVLTKHRALSGIDIYTTGIFAPRIYVTPRLLGLLTPREYDAVIAHELGHIANGHVWKNLVLAMVLPFSRPPSLAVRQELQADLFAARLGYAHELASALRKLSTHSFDLVRAELLSRRDAGDPGARDERQKVSSERGEK